MDNKAKPMRAVAVFDIELDGGFSVATAFHAEFEAFAKDYDARFQTLTHALEHTFEMTSQPTPEQTLQVALADIARTRTQL